VSGLGWSRIRAVARELAVAEPAERLAEAAPGLLEAPEVGPRMLAV
jgi:hypothetical protein